jgi:hypothetical protein
VPNGPRGEYAETDRPVVDDRSASTSGASEYSCVGTAIVIVNLSASRRMIGSARNPLRSSSGKPSSSCQTLPARPSAAIGGHPCVTGSQKRVPRFIGSSRHGLHPCARSANSDLSAHKPYPRRPIVEFSRAPPERRFAALHRVRRDGLRDPSRSSVDLRANIRGVASKRARGPKH